MIVVTGAAGFIGSQTLLGLNAKNRTDLLAVDDLRDGKKYKNLAAATFADYMDYETFLEMIISDTPFPEKIEAVIHQGACSVTTEWDGRYMMRVNYDYTKALFHYCQRHNIPFVYASSAAVYGGNQVFSECSSDEMPLNVYGYSKWLFDGYMQSHMTPDSAQVVGLRYFNVYGPHEAHKGAMASVTYHFTNQLIDTGTIKLFGAAEGCGAGEHRRDFVYVTDVVNVALWMLDHSEVSGIFNVGTGTARTFNELGARLLDVHGSGAVEYIPFPDKLKGCYQSFTEADITALRSVGYDAPFVTLEQGVERYYQWLAAS
jgi:ADP-L-glycero-D-manno-heptose 6-epimerase